MFEYRYRKQNQQYHSSSNHNNGHGHYQKHKNGRNKSHFMNNHYQQPSFMNQNNVVNRINYQPVATTSVQTQHYQPEPRQHSAVSIETFSKPLSAPLTPGSNGLTSSSPDSFSISDDHLHSRLSSSVISSGGSTSSYSSTEFEVNKFDLQFKLPMSNVDKFGSNIVGEEFNGGFTNNSAGFNMNGKSDKSSGWLNIWGSDMSVWG